MNHSIEVHHNEGIGFTDEKHVVNFLYYLFRTDPSQKWTKDQTNYNFLVIARKGSFDFRLFGNIANRKRLRSAAAQFVEVMMRRASGIDALLNDILYYDVTDDNTGDSLLTGQDGLRVRKETIQYLLGEVSQKQMTSSFFVVHVDQGNEHIHTVYLDQGVREW